MTVEIAFADTKRSSRWPGHQPVAPPRNVGEKERRLSMGTGACLALLGLSRRSGPGLIAALAGASLVYRGWSGHCWLYEQLGLNSAENHSGIGVAAGRGRKVTCGVHINRDRQELFDFWRKLQNLPDVMQHLVSVTPIDDKTSRWVARGPLDQSLEWQAEIITDRPGEVIAWQSLPGSRVRTAGSVRFRTPASGEGTEILVSLQYDPPGGRVVAELAHLVGQGLQAEVEQDLRAFKQLMEAGEIATAASRADAQK